MRAGIVQSVYTLGAGAHTCSCSMGNESKPPRREADHSHSSNAAVKNMWSYTSTPTIYIYSVDREKLYLHLYDRD